MENIQNQNQDGDKVKIKVSTLIIVILIIIIAAIFYGVALSGNHTKGWEDAILKGKDCGSLTREQCLEIYSNQF